MARYMKNRSGVVAYADDGLLSQEALGFVRCTELGEDWPVASDPAVGQPAAAVAAPVTATKTTKKSSRKGK